MSNMRNTLIIEADRAGRKYQLITPNDPNIGELIDVCSEMLAHCIKLVEDLEKETEKKKKETEEKLNNLVAKEKEAATQS